MSSPAASIPPAARKGGGMAVLGLILLVIGVLLAVLAAVRIVGGVATALNVPTFEVPGTITQQLEAGSSTVYAYVGPDGQAPKSGGTFTPEDVTIEGPGGAQVQVNGMGATESVTLGTDTYRGIASFVAPTAGAYTVTISGKAPTGRAAVSRSVMSTVGSSLAWIFAAVAGGLLALVGLVLGIVGLVRRFSTPRTPAPPASTVSAVAPAAPAGWYADPSNPSVQRYWDGTAWTEDRA